MGLLDENEQLREGKNLKQYQGVLEENHSLKEQVQSLKANQAKQVQVETYAQVI
jgi:hypothetical protein